MLSIIICSINKKLLTQLESNIKETIGIEYELIVIDNNIEKLSIAKAYNEGVLRARYEHLVFCHEDIRFHTNNWGESLVNALNGSDIGLIGVSGALIKTKAPINWSKVPKEYFRISALQQFNNTTANVSVNPLNELLSEVAVLDGLFLACKKKIIKEIPFDEESLNGFHLYDMDISLRIGKKYKVMVSHNLSIEHFSTGNLDINWFKESIQWHKKYSKELPVSINLSSIEIKNIYYENLKDTILFSLKFNYSRLFELNTLLKMIYLNFFKFDNLLFFKFIISKTLKSLFIK